MHKRAVLARGGDKARRSSGRAPVKAVEGRGWARRIVRRWTKQPVVVGNIKLVKWRTVGDAELALSAAQASNQPLTRSLRSQLGYSLPTADSLPDDLYSRNHSKKAQQAAHDGNKPSGRAAHVKYETDHSHGSASSAAHQQLLVAHIQVDALGTVTVVIAAAATLKREQQQQADDDEDDEGRQHEDDKEAEQDMVVKKEESGEEEAVNGRQVRVEDEEEEAAEEKKEAEDDEAEKADDDMEAEDEKDDEEDEVEEDEKEQREDEQQAEQKQQPPDSPQSPSSDDSDFDADEPSPSSSRPLALPPSDDPSLPSLLPLPAAASASSSSMPTPSPLLAVKDEDEVMREMDAHTWEDEHAGSGEAHHELAAGEVDGDDNSAAGMTDDMQ